MPSRLATLKAMTMPMTALYAAIATLSDGRKAPKDGKTRWERATRSAIISEEDSSRDSMMPAVIGTDVTLRATWTGSERMFATTGDPRILICIRFTSRGPEEISLPSVIAGP